MIVKHDDQVVTLPDIHADVLATHPYAIILVSLYDDGTYDYMPVVSTDALLYIDASIFGDSSNVLVSMGLYRLGFIKDSEWAFTNEGDGLENPLDVGEINETPTVSINCCWANHDILSVVDVDAEDNFILEGIYFPVTFEEKYTAPSEWFVSVADQARRLSGVNKRYTRDEMLDIFEGVTKTPSAEGVMF